MLRVAESYSATDTGRARRHNEDSLYARAPLFVVADGMGGAQAGEVASSTAVELFGRGLGDDGGSTEERLSALVREANALIHDLSQINADQAGMGTTLTAVYTGPDEVVIAHVGDSRAYCLRDGELLRLTDDHSLVDELLRQGKLTPEEAEDHPQRSIITRALGPEPDVDVDTHTHHARAQDVYLLCSDGLTSMISEARLADILVAHGELRAAGEALIAAANEAGGRDNITVVLFRLADVEGAPPERDQPTLTGMRAPDLSSLGPSAPGPAPGSSSGIADRARVRVDSPAPTSRVGVGRIKTRRSRAAPVPRRAPRRPDGTHVGASPPRRRRRRWLTRLIALSLVLGVIIIGGYFAIQAVYFIGTNSRGFVTVFSGLPYQLPGPIRLYSQYYVSGVPASSVAPARRRDLLDHSLRSLNDASDLVRQLELGQIAGASTTP